MDSNSLFDIDRFDNNNISTNKTKPDKKQSKNTSNKKPATHLMKMVASRAPNPKTIKKVFSENEVNDVLLRARNNVSLEPSEIAMLKERYRSVKKHAKQLEQGNQSRLIVFPSINGKGEWYKVMDFSALYYVYRLADRMGRSARLLKDSDKFSKALYIASFQNIQKFKEQYERIEGGRPVETDDGILIFDLKRALTDDEVGELRMVEETRREKMHNILRPKAMDPATYQAILMVVRQVLPRVRKMDSRYFYVMGESMMNEINNLLGYYFLFADGTIDRKEAGIALLQCVEKINAGLAILAELRVWPYDVAGSISENVNELKRVVVKEFNLKIGKNDG